MHPSWVAKRLYLPWNIKCAKPWHWLHKQFILTLYQRFLQADRVFFVVANIQFTMSPLSHLAVLVNVYSQSTCSNHKGKMFTLTPLLSTIFFHICLPPNTFVLPPHASQALSSCLVETQTISSIISRSQQLFYRNIFTPFFFQYAIPLLCQFNWKKGNSHTAFTSEGDNMW